MAPLTQDHGFDREQPGGTLNVGVVFVAADLPVNALVALSDNYTVVDITTANQPVIGSVVKPADVAGGKGTIRVGGHILKDVQAAGPIAIGAAVSSAADDGNGVQQVDDGGSNAFGIALKSAAGQGDLIDVLRT